ncbi:MAG TPA: CbiX/SirB N-terminal domain-containing protein [Thermodesulfobacteriota bacterium]|nr:CbiX/SirB N-terminal domain-containing protein [Thermodesulfobacteriota bacterium]
MAKKKRALILVDHGSVVKEANDMLIEIASMVRENCNSGFDIVRYAHMELAEPTIKQAFDACVSDGAEDVVVHPYFLAPGRHSTRDIPRMVEEAAQRYSHVSYVVTEPLGIHQKIVEVVLERALDKTSNH